MKKLIIGIIGGDGQMGKYFASFFRNNGFEVIISDLNTKLTNKELAKKADVVIVSVPIDRTEEAISEAAPHVKETGLLMDITSFKSGPMEAMRNTKASYLGCHPLFGPSADIEGQLVIMCPGRGDKWFNRMKALFIKNGVTVKILTPEKHDELMAYIQALTHFSDIAFVDTLRKSKIPIDTFLGHESPVYRLEMDMMGRILNQDPNLYANIQIGNPLSAKVTESFIQSCQELAGTIDKKDFEGNIDFFERCADYLGNFRKTAMAESDRLLQYFSPTAEVTITETPKKHYDLAVLGPKNTFSDLAAQKYAPKSSVYYAPSINDVFDMVEKGMAKEGLVPMENSLSGSVRETLDELYSGNMWISKIIPQPIRLALIGNRKSVLNKISVIYSHSQPLLQCRNFLKKHCKNAVFVPVSSTTEALKRISEAGLSDSAAIASKTAAELMGLKVLKDGIEDFSGNTTYFAVICKNSKFKTLFEPEHVKVQSHLALCANSRCLRSEWLNSKGKKISIAFTFGKDAPGTLYGVLGCLAESGINMTKIESRPSSKERGEYVFYIDFEGNLNDVKVKKALSSVKKTVAKLKVLGCY